MDILNIVVAAIGAVGVLLIALGIGREWVRRGQRAEPVNDGTLHVHVLDEPFSASESV